MRKEDLRSDVNLSWIKYRRFTFRAFELNVKRVLASSLDMNL